jgi:phage gp36-like protein
MPRYLTQEDLENELSRKLLLEIFDDDTTGEIDTGQIQHFIDKGEAEVDSQLAGFYGMPLGDLNDRLVRLAALDYTVAFIYERHPEAVQQFGDAIQVNRYERAEKRMQKVQSALKRLTENSPSKGPKNIGGIVYDSGPRLMVDSANGTYNGGDF